MTAITVLGEALWDLYPEGGSVRTSSTIVRHLGGAPANVACTLARLGVDVAMIASVGDDALGEGLRDELAQAGVAIEHVVTVRARTGITFVELRDGSPRFLPFRSPSADMLLPTSAVPDSIEWLHLGSSSFATSARDATLLAIARAREVSIDLNIYPFLFRDGLGALDAVIESARIVKASESDLRALGMAAEALHARRAHGITIATFGAGGARAWVGDEVIDQPAHTAEVVDAAGAGDAFVAGVLASLLRGRTTREALELGAQLGARAVCAIGATTALRDLSAERAALARLR